MTTRDPGASEVLTQGLVVRPRSTARLRHQPGADEDLGVRRVGAARDRRDDHVAVTERATARGRGGGPARLVAEGLPECPPALDQGHAVLGARRAGQAGLDGREVELDRLGEDGLVPGRLVPESLLLGVGLDQGDVVVGTPREAQVVKGGAVDREHRAGGPVLGGHVADGGAILDRDGGEPGTEALDELAHDAVPPEQLVMVSTRSVAVVPSGSSPERRSPTTGGSSMERG